jgi:methionine aminopeptidase
LEAGEKPAGDAASLLSIADALYAVGLEQMRPGQTIDDVAQALQRWPRDFGQGDKLFPLERETGRYGQGDTEALRG